MLPSSNVGAGAVMIIVVWLSPIISSVQRIKPGSRKVHSSLMSTQSELLGYKSLLWCDVTYRSGQLEVEKNQSVNGIYMPQAHKAS